MPKRILLCTELSPAQLRAKALVADTPRERKRGLVIAHVLDGLSRAEAARLTDQTAQAVKDAVVRYNADGLAGLKDRAHTGRPPKLDAGRRQELHDIVRTGPDVETEHLSAYTREDIARIAQERWGVTYAVTSIGRLLREAGLSRQKMRPSPSEQRPRGRRGLLKKRPARLNNLQLHIQPSICASSCKTSRVSARRAASVGVGSRAASVRQG